MKTLFRMVMAAGMVGAGLLVGGGFAFGEELAPAQKLELFLLVGQSNMSGRGAIEPQDQAPHPRVWTLDRENHWKPAVDPLHFDKSIAGVGLGTTFGKTLAEKNPNAWIGLVPCAVGGTSIDQWKKGGKLYTDAIKRARLALKQGAFKGILWHQGEADCGGDKPTKYLAKLTQLIADFRADLDAPEAPFIAGQLGEFHVSKAPGTKTINALLADLPRSVPHTGCARSGGLTSKGDNTHFDAASLREFGKRYAQEYGRLLQ